MEKKAKSSPNNIRQVDASADTNDELPLLKVPLGVPQSTAILKTPGLCTATAIWKSKISSSDAPMLDNDGNLLNTPMTATTTKPNGELVISLEPEGNTQPNINGSAHNLVRPSIAITQAPHEAGSRPTSRLSGRASCSSLSLLAHESGKLLQAVPLATGASSGQLPEIASLTINNHPLLAAIPYMSVPLAYVCLLFNIFIPGLGTLIAGMSVFFCKAEPQVHTKKEEIINNVCTNVCVGVSQFFTITFLFVGLIWSITWGVFMVVFAIEYRNFQRDDKARATAKAVTKAFMGRC